MVAREGDGRQDAGLAFIEFAGDGFSGLTAATAFVDGDVVNIEVELVGAVEVADGHITSLAGIGAEVDSVFIVST